MNPPIDSHCPLILVVDDAPDSIEPIVNCLHRANFRTRIATNGERALALAHSKPLPDLILLDITMPDMDGYEVCRQLMDDAATANAGGERHSAVEVDLARGTYFVVVDGYGTGSAGTYRLREETFTVRIEGQEGRRVWGNISSSQRVGERLIGSIAADNKAVYFVSGEGYIDGVVVDANTMDICYRHVLPGSAVVACNQWVRQK